jgi:1,4-dihydroxy-2-naphthoate octaprenyltransferase
VAAAAGFVLSAVVDLRLLAVGAASIAAAALYTGGPRPYGYSGFGELAVLVFFGFVATVGSAYVHTEDITGTAVLASVPVGLVACALLVVNNLRDIPTDTEAGKRTLAVRLGAPRTRMLYRACIVGAYAAVLLLAVARPPVILALGTAPLAVVPLRLVSTRRDPPGLIAALVATGRLQLAQSSILAVGLWVS